MAASSPVFHYLNGSLGFPAPFREGGSKMMSFVFKSDTAKLQAVCDAWFNTPTNGDLYYQPLLPIVLVTYASNQQSRPDVPPYNAWGSVAYNEVIFSIFVVRVKKLGSVWVAEHVGALVPYIFVDDAIVMAGGREVYGMPKALGRIALPSDPSAPDKHFALESVSSARFSPDVPFSWLPIASIQQQPEAQPPAHHAWADMTEAFEALKHLVFGGSHIELPGIGLAIEVADMFLEKKLPFCSLRQVRSVASSEAAAYQAAVEFSAKMLKFNGAGLMHGTYQITLPQNDLFPLASDLGLTTGQQSEAAFWLDWDFLFETGREVWTAQERPTFWDLLRRIFNL